MSGLPLPDKPSDPVGPCRCGSALPHRLCCGARRLADPHRSTLFAEGEMAEQVAREWDLAVTTVSALVRVLPDVPVPLLGNVTLRELYHAGAEQRHAAIGFSEAVARSAETMGINFPIEVALAALATPQPPEYSLEDRQNLVLCNFTLHLLARGIEIGAILGAQRLFRDLLRHRSANLENPAVTAAAVDYAVCWMHFRPEASDEYEQGYLEVAELYGVAANSLAEEFVQIKQALKLVWFDPRYAIPDATWEERLEQTGRALAEGSVEEL
ncbi:MAG: hypothetical protein ACUVX8_18150 [Candidatus Zipacnadales bacterium]